MKYRIIGIAGIAVALPVGAAIAGDEMGTSEASQAMTELDADGNGELSEEEVVGSDLEAQFATLDADGNGAISAEEFHSGSGIGGPETGADSAGEATTDDSGLEEDSGASESDTESGSY